MSLNGSPVELTTAATDVVLSLVCVGVVLGLTRPRVHDPWKTTLWSWVFVLLAVASAIGAVVHGFELTESVQAVLWSPLYLFLELTGALFLVGAVNDAFGRRAAQRLVPWAIGVGLAFHVLTYALNGGFLPFVVYEAVAMVGALALYGRLAINGRLAGAGVVTAGIGLTLLAGLVQVSDISIRLVVPFDHNGVFHLVQVAALATLGHGLRVGLANVPVQAARDQPPPGQAIRDLPHGHDVGRASE